MTDNLASRPGYQTSMDIHSTPSTNIHCFNFFSRFFLTVICVAKKRLFGGQGHYLDFVGVFSIVSDTSNYKHNNGFLLISMAFPDDLTKRENYKYINLHL